MSFEVTGKLIDKGETQRVSDRFQKREFVLELLEDINGNTYTNYAKMQLVQGKCDIIDRFEVGNNIKVNFNIKGSKYEKEGRINYFTNLDAWRIEQAQEGAQQSNGSNAGNNQGTNANANNGGNRSNWNNGGSNTNPGSTGGDQNPGSSVAFNSGGNYNPAPENADDLPF